MRSRRARSLAAGAVAVLGAGAIAVAAFQLSAETMPAESEALAPAGGKSPAALAREARGGESEKQNGPAQQDYESRAWPKQHVTADRVLTAQTAFRKLPKGVPGSVPLTSSWEELGPFVPKVPGFLAYTVPKPQADRTNSGRVTDLAIKDGCVAGNCVLYVAAAGGGVWKTTDAMAPVPSYTPITEGKIPTTAIGSILIDPTDPTGNTLYVGTGEENGSSDSEAGLGLYKSTDGGATWAVVPGSFAVAKDRAIGAIAVDPINRDHIVIGTAVARHGTAQSIGGRFTPPGAPKIGLYESWNGGQTFKLRFSRAQDPVIPTTPNGADFFRGGVTDIEWDRTGLGATEPTRFYFSMFAWGLYRVAGDGPVEHVFRSAGEGKAAASISARTEFALAPLGNGKLRIYLGDAGADSVGKLYRTDDANRPASELIQNFRNVGWTLLSNPTPGTPGYSSWNFCQTQCSYDMLVASPPGRPDNVWIGGAMFYGEGVLSGPPLSNGRAVMESVTAGVDFDDMTSEDKRPPDGIHPDNRVAVFAPDGTTFEGSDGGVVRIWPGRSDASDECVDPRNLTGARLADCQRWLDRIPSDLDNINSGLRTLQFQQVSINPQDERNDILGGTQDNGTWSGTNLDSGTPDWFETINGDGGFTGIDPVDPNVRYHTYFLQQIDVNFRGTDPRWWNWISDRLFLSGETSSFYTPILADPVVGGTLFVGMQHVWRTLDHGGPKEYLEEVCNEFTGTFTGLCGDFVPLGGEQGSNTAGDLCGTFYGTTHTSAPGGCWITALDRSENDENTLWAGTRRGRLFITKNARGVPASKVKFVRLDNDSTPFRFVSGIAIDENRQNTAYVSFSGYNAYTPTTPGHVFKVDYKASDGSATWTDISYNIGDIPVLDVEYDNETGDLWASTDWGVLRLPAGETAWQSTPGLPPVATYGLTMGHDERILYAATHGRGVYRIDLPGPAAAK